MKNAMNFRPVGLMLLFCLIPLWAFAQSVMVKGVVKDTSGEAIIGASAWKKALPTVRLPILMVTLH